MTWLAAAILALAALAGVALTLLTLPGVWLTLLAAGLIQWWREPFSWWTLGACLALALLAEVYELVASAAGSARAGGGRSGALLSIVGSLVGAVAGTFILPIPILGTLLGAIAGAGAGALIGERGIAQRSWRDSARVARGAAVGRFLATVVKAVVAGLVGVILFAAALIP